MASYTVIGKTSGGSTLVSVRIDGVYQEEPHVDELAVVNALKTFLLTVPNVTQTIAQKQEWITTQV